MKDGAAMKENKVQGIPNKTTIERPCVNCKFCDLVIMSTKGRGYCSNEWYCGPDKPGLVRPGNYAEYIPRRSK